MARQPRPGQGGLAGEPHRRGPDLTLAALLIVWLAAAWVAAAERPLELAALTALYVGAEPGLLVLARWTTQLGGWEVLVPAGLAGVLGLALRGRARDAVLLLLILGGGRLAVHLHKLAVARARPDGGEHLVAVLSPSFPSGHAANAAITYVALALLLGGRRAGVLAGALLLVLLIGLSRVALGVHWPSDVVGGWAFGLLWTLAALRLAGLRAQS